MLSSNRGQGIFEDLKALRPRTSKCVLKNSTFAFDILACLHQRTATVAEWSNVLGLLRLRNQRKCLVVGGMSSNPIRIHF